MVLSESDQRLLDAVATGLPLVPEPYAALARQLGMTETAMLARLAELRDAGLIRRLGVVVRHRELGYHANAMVVWDLPDHRVPDVAPRLAARPEVTLCYRRPRRPPGWPYNLFCMIHGRDRPVVEAQLRDIVAALDLDEVPLAVLFSVRRFKQRGARYAPAPEAA
jgi:DNA-binding Lrp family transcriptional regulator